MKKKISILLSVLFLCLAACSKDDAEDVTDCIGESLLSTFNHSEAVDNVKQINFTIFHSGEPAISSVNWNFGDNKTQTSNSGTISHTYTQAGTYKVSYTVHLNNSCSFDKTHNITVK